MIPSPSWSPSLFNSIPIRIRCGLGLNVQERTLFRAPLSEYLSRCVSACGSSCLIPLCLFVFFPICGLLCLYMFYRCLCMTCFACFSLRVFFSTYLFPSALIRRKKNKRSYLRHALNFPKNISSSKVPKNISLRVCPFVSLCRCVSVDLPGYVCVCLVCLSVSVCPCLCVCVCPSVFVFVWSVCSYLFVRVCLCLFVRVYLSASIDFFDFFSASKLCFSKILSF